MSRDVKSEIQAEVDTNPILLYSKGNKLMPQCGFSAVAMELLDRLGVEYKVVDVLADPEKRQALKEFSDWPTFPQLYVAGELVGGADIMREMHEKGELEPLLRKPLAS